MLGSTKNIFKIYKDHKLFLIEKKGHSCNFSLWPHGPKRRHAGQQGKRDGAVEDESSFISACSSVFVKVFATKSTTPISRVETWGAIPFNSPLA